MDPNLLQSMVDYIELTQDLFNKGPVVKQAQAPAVDKETVATAVDTLVKYGSVEPSERDTVINAIVQKPITAVEMLVKMCSRIKPAVMGVPSDKIATSKLDAVARFCLGITD